jgi:hypothetical protein
MPINGLSYKEQHTGGSMKKLPLVLLLVFIFSTTALLSAGDFILYGGSQKVGDLNYHSAKTGTNSLVTGDFGGTFGVRFSGGRILGFEQNISYSPKFAKPGLKAFQMDSNLVLQAPGKIAPYATAGIGFIRSWGKDTPTNWLDLNQVTDFAFSFGTNFSYNYGGGLKLRKLAGPLGVNIDVRGYTLPGVRNDNLSFIQTSAGLVISW